VTDDAAAISLAVQSGRPVRFGPRTYVVNGQFTLARDGVTFLGTPGATVLKRGAQAGNGAWEIRSFLCAMGALPDRPGRVLAYEHGPQWVTGLGFAEILAAP